MKEEIKLLVYVLSKPNVYKWETPIAHMVLYCPDADAGGVLNLSKTGCFSISLNFWWHVEWPLKI